ncbi:2-oxoglutarate dehydrogenase, E2 component, dihydrolipoamide succinyltransferase [Rhodoluna lacicola]|uniref:Dihydrolipoamide acetyltransferase component of pyruvate dehydrogenase complex n=1 Tax=Rhodoluna lacicola TaxID=529884 RepID=A0A060JFY7_9MICO|nr:2-oxoglutarate dehydrogenase, E2 component, dihydrolipoamide succinyltransferase [Rhodoluna lacicola]AIC47482.1 2-oxoglutarate dehydrogenase, E2 component, dihydrolipoamide succinyltransferase [Rhodoluna lacicola]
MSEQIVLPALGESVTEGTVTRWLKKVGDTVAVDEPLVEVSTDKVDTEIPSPVAGVIEQILVQEDETVQVGAVLVVIGSGSGAAAPAAAPVAEAPVAPAPIAETPAPVAAPAAPVAPPVAAPVAPVAPVAAPSTPTTSPTPTNVDAGYVTPLVRKLASEIGIDLSKIAGTGVGGRIRKDDVLAASSAPAAAPIAFAAPVAASAPAATFVPGAASPLRGTTEPMSRLRKVLAERAVASMVSTAQLTTVVEVDVTKIAALRSRIQAQFVAATGGKLNFMPFFALAAAEALRVHPKLNATIDGENIVYHGTENISFAVDTEKGLLTPVIRDASTLNIAQIAKQIADLAARTRASQLKPDELGGGTFTLTNTGSRGALFDTPVVFLPQVAILGTGVVTKRPVVVTDANGQDSISIRSMVYLALSYDHRLVDGADASRFLVDVKSRLEEANFDGVLGI